MEISKKDWALFRSKIGEWQEAYMHRLNQEYIELLSKEASPSEKFWELDKRLKEDKRKPGVQLQLRKSNVLFDLAALLSDGAICMEDLSEFSQELQEAVDLIRNGLAGTHRELH